MGRAVLPAQRWPASAWQAGCCWTIPTTPTPCPCSACWKRPPDRLWVRPWWRCWAKCWNWAHRPRPAMKSWGGNWLLWARRPCSGREDRQRPCTRACSGAVMVALGCRGGRGGFCDNLGKNGGPAARRRRIVQGFARQPAGAVAGGLAGAAWAVGGRAAGIVSVAASASVCS